MSTGRFWHEPENDIQDGTFTAADYKAAFVHLDKLADTADNPRLKSTVILQSYSTRPESGRNWRNYMPNPGHVDVLAWDVYNRPSPEAGYQVPPDLLDGPIQASRSIGKPFASRRARQPDRPWRPGLRARRVVATDGRLSRPASRVVRLLFRLRVEQREGRLPAE